MESHAKRSGRIIDYLLVWGGRGVILKESIMVGLRAVISILLERGEIVAARA
jgi:hypothetical protein